MPDPVPEPPEHALLRVSDTLALPRAELAYRASRAGGPGGQHVNTSSTRVELTWDVASSPSLSHSQRARLREKLANRIDSEGVLHLAAAGSRSQHQNREEVTERLRRMLERALRVRKRRKKTKVPRAQKEKRLREKKRRAEVKKTRGRVRRED